MSYRAYGRKYQRMAKRKQRWANRVPEDPLARKPKRYAKKNPPPPPFEEK